MNSCRQSFGTKQSGSVKEIKGKTFYFRSKKYESNLPFHCLSNQINHSKTHFSDTKRPGNLSLLPYTKNYVQNILKMLGILLATEKKAYKHFTLLRDPLHMKHQYT